MPNPNKEINSPENPDLILSPEDIDALMQKPWDKDPQAWLQERASLAKQRGQKLIKEITQKSLPQLEDAGAKPQDIAEMKALGQEAQKLTDKFENDVDFVIQIPVDAEKDYEADIKKREKLKEEFKKKRTQVNKRAAKSAKISTTDNELPVSKTEGYEPAKEEAEAKALIKQAKQLLESQDWLSIRKLAQTIYKKTGDTGSAAALQSSISTDKEFANEQSLQTLRLYIAGKELPKVKPRLRRYY